jgi:DNA-3-methyladenine glycosylase
MKRRRDREESLPREFYLRETLDVARDLLGMELVHRAPQGATAGIIVEAEAYLGVPDRAAHAWGGRRTSRTEILYAAGGRAYVFLVYGLHSCLNIVTGREGVPECVLIRALEPTEGIPLMRERRGLKPDAPLRQLTDGPGKLCRAMGIDLSLYGADLCGDTLYVRRPAAFAPPAILASPRIGIDYAGEDRDRPWRFHVRGNPFVSRP